MNDFAASYIRQVDHGAENKLMPAVLWKQTLGRLCSDVQTRNNFSLHWACYQHIYPQWRSDMSPVVYPKERVINHANMTHWLQRKNVDNVHCLQQWSHQNYDVFWQEMAEHFKLRFHRPAREVADISAGVEAIQWFPEATLNIAENCFYAPKQRNAIVYQNTTTGLLESMSYQELDQLSNQVANGLVALGLKPKDAVAIDMVMTTDAVAIYLGIIKAGCVAVSIADSFSAAEVETRLKIANSKLIFTHDVIQRGEKILPLYDKILYEDLVPAVVLPINENNLQVKLRSQDHCWQEFLSKNNAFSAIPCSPDDYSGILFSSGTTGEPKAIPWTQTTPLKCASDAFFHQDIHEGDILCWPTNLGWMMGPWLIYAALMNQATIALYTDMPTTRQFGEFVAKAGVTMLGVIPSIVNTWRKTQCMEKTQQCNQSVDWSAIRVLTSTAECSNPEDMFYLMFLAGYKPIVEYCGGTEIGGAYITSSVVEPCAPSVFTMPAMGMDFCLVDEDSKVSQRQGAVMIKAPCVGLSTTLLNKDHHQEYYANVTLDQGKGMVWRSHGDQIICLDKHAFRLQGRNDDTMNLGGIKTSSAEIERVVNTLEAIKESAAIAVNHSNGGPSKLWLYVVTWGELAEDDLGFLQKQAQQALKANLNPLFKIERMIVLEALPKTASNKIIRKKLREESHAA